MKTLLRTFFLIQTILFVNSLELNAQMSTLANNMHDSVGVVNNKNISDVQNPASVKAVTLNLTAIIGGFYAYGGSNISDVVEVELHNAIDYAFVESTTGILNNYGLGSFNFNLAENGIPYYIVLKHRNALETWSSTSQKFLAGLLTYDFTISQSQAFGNNLVNIDGILGWKWCLYNGDVNHDGLIDFRDVMPVYNDAVNAVAGYNDTDLTNDDFVDSVDEAIVEYYKDRFIQKKRPY